MSDRTREDTPEPEDHPNQIVESRPSSEIQSYLESIQHVKVNLDLLSSEACRECFPSFPQLHDLTWLTLYTKMKIALSIAERFYRTAHSNGWLRQQTSPLGKGLKIPSKVSKDMRRSCEFATSLLEDLSALQSQILAGQHRMPEGEQRLERPKFAPWIYRTAPNQLPEPRSDYHDNIEDLIESPCISREMISELGETAADIKRYRIVLCPDVKELEEIKWLGEQKDEYPPIVSVHYESLEEIINKKEADKKNEHPLGEANQESGDSSATQLVKQSEDNINMLPSIHQVFGDDDFMKTSFADQGRGQIQLRKETEFDLYAAEEGRQAAYPLLRKAMTTCDHRISVRHNHVTGRLEVCEYFHDRSRPYLAHEHWARV